MKNFDKTDAMTRKNYDFFEAWVKNPYTGRPEKVKIPVLDVVHNLIRPTDHINLSCDQHDRKYYLKVGVFPDETRYHGLSDDELKTTAATPTTTKQEGIE